MAEKYGPAFILRLGTRRTLIVSGWEIAKECFTTNDKVLATRPKSASGDNMSYNYAMFGFSPYGAYWREMRKIATLELLCNRRLESLKHVRVTEVGMCMKELYGRWVHNGRSPVQVEMKQRLFELTFNTLIMMIVGKRFFSGAHGINDEAAAIKIRKLMERSSYLSGVFVVVVLEFHGILVVFNSMVH
ncbi:xanthotoxin 5-hydroxylase CYP82C4-like [Magnolia sinica]|uniref:xanthotoxin 5-hydroxylase CYP82C4-like n=1 Tax=Magnolia sinica TaxID=86752 RepID=UPI00265B050A|nr:xanthotoxin 5-hydroxylase CYP82C4-like [Magnolia sinica]